MMRIIFIIIMVAAVAASERVRAADEFYKGKTIKLFEGASPGSGTDAYTRAIQMYYGKHIPGNPSVIIQYMPGGGGMAATNQTYNVAAKDGTELGLFNRNTIVRQVLGEKNALFEPARFNWIGTPGSYGNDAWVFMINAALPYKTIEDLQSAPKPLNVAGVGSSNPFVPIVRDLLHVKMKFIIGYSGPRAMLALESGEVDAFGTGFGTVKSIKHDWVTGNKVRFMVQFGHSERLKALPDIPTGQELVKSKDDIALINLAESALKIGWPLVAPPEVPSNRIAILRASFRKLMADADFRAALEKSKLEFSPLYGEKLQNTVAGLAATPKSVLDRYKGLFEKH